MNGRLGCLVLVLAAAGASGSASETGGPYISSANFSADLAGQPDTRAGAWGTEGSDNWKLTFHPPRGYRVQVLRIDGDFLVWPRGSVPKGKFAGALFSVHTSAQQPGTPRCELCADDCMLYVQTATGGEVSRITFNRDVSAGGVLGDDNALLLKVAVWLNDTGLTVHMEPTFNVTYRFVQTAAVNSR